MGLACRSYTLLVETGDKPKFCPKCRIQVGHIHRQYLNLGTTDNLVRSSNSKHHVAYICQRCANKPRYLHTALAKGWAVEEVTRCGSDPSHWEHSSWKAAEVPTMKCDTPVCGKCNTTIRRDQINLLQCPNCDYKRTVLPTSSTYRAMLDQRPFGLTIDPYHGTGIHSGAMVKKVTPKTTTKTGIQEYHCILKIGSREVHSWLHDDILKELRSCELPVAILVGPQPVIEPWKRCNGKWFGIYWYYRSIDSDGNNNPFSDRLEEVSECRYVLESPRSTKTRMRPDEESVYGHQKELRVVVEETSGSVGPLLHKLLRDYNLRRILKKVVDVAEARPGLFTTDPIESKIEKVLAFLDTLGKEDNPQPGESSPISDRLNAESTPASKSADSPVSEREREPDVSAPPPANGHSPDSVNSRSLELDADQAPAPVSAPTVAASGQSPDLGSSRRRAVLEKTSSKKTCWGFP